ncbi:hypothetical protein H072_3536 [Dactylellina haptotyla CBS 200.50]|uniref:Integral membrane protein n=1 Tax=Dactylellina haptotyla (strain CBS 200.50) TaxID=1284197 RepID=S8BSP2_DACHA|nr:hypothetical protein H072_3536 [Dactylellina haptotyla CBS 200.50]
MPVKGKTAGETYIQSYLRLLQTNPLQTKMVTSGTLSALQELLASLIAGDKKHGSYLTPRVPMMAIYGAFISAPLGHLLINILQRAFRNRTSTRAKILQILVSNFIVSPIQNVVYLASMAVIAGARKKENVKAMVRTGFFPVMKVSWITSPLALAFAQKFLPEHAWVPFFNLIGFIIGTYVNALTKKKRMAALEKKKYGKDHHNKDSYYSKSDYR